MELITVEQAIRSTDRVIGICVLIMVAVLFLGWLYCGALKKQLRKSTAKKVAKAVADERAKLEAEQKARGTAQFIQYCSLKNEIRHLTSDLDEAKTLVKRLEGENQRLKRLMEKSHA